MKIFSHVLFFLCLPAFLLSPIPSAAFYSEPIYSAYEKDHEKIFDIPIDESGRVNPWILLKPDNLSIDRYFAFIDLACDEAFLETLTEEEFDRVVGFMTTMLRSSAPESHEDLVESYDNDIEEIIDALYGDQKWEIAYSYGFDFKFAPHLSFVKTDVFLCKNWFKRKAHHFGHWCKKHKKPLIAGAVVVGVVAVAIATGGVGGSSAAAVGGGIIDNTYRDDRPKHINKPGEVYVDNEFPQPDLPSLFQSSGDYICLPQRKIETNRDVISRVLGAQISCSLVRPNAL